MWAKVVGALRCSVFPAPEHVYRCAISAMSPFLLSPLPCSQLHPRGAWAFMLLAGLACCPVPHCAPPPAGADTVNAARAFMFALGCIQSLKCNTNKCPTGVTSQDPELMAGLVVGDKAERVLRYHQKTVHAALEIVGAIGLESPKDIEARHIFRRVSSTKVLSYEQQYPAIEVRARALPARALREILRAVAPAA